MTFKRGIILCTPIFLLVILIGTLTSLPHLLSRDVRANYAQESNALQDLLENLGTGHVDYIFTCSENSHTHWSTNQHCVSYGRYPSDFSFNAQPSKSLHADEANLDTVLKTRGWQAARPQDGFTTLSQADSRALKNSTGMSGISFYKNIGHVSCNLSIDVQALGLHGEKINETRLLVNEFSCTKEFAYPALHVTTSAPHGP